MGKHMSRKKYKNFDDMPDGLTREYALEHEIARQGGKTTYVDLENGGPPRVVTPESLVTEIEGYIPNADLPQIQLFRRMTNGAQRVYREKYGEPYQDFERLRRKLAREIKSRQDVSGTAPAPNALIRNSHYTRQLFLDWDTVYRPDETQIPGPELAEDYVDTLASRPAGYIIDAVESYVREYFENGPNDHMKLTSEKDYYVIKDTFNDFCRRADIQGEDRVAVKKALFPPKGQAGLLERVKFILPEEGRKYAVNIRFISARQVFTEKRDNLLQDKTEAVQAFEMDVHARLFNFLEHREDIRGGKAYGKLREGYQHVPIALNAKINRAINLKESLIPVDSRWQPVRRHKDRFRKAILYLIDRWNTGRQNRASDMIVPWGELKDRGILPAHNHGSRKHHRREDMVVVFHVARTVHREQEVFDGCSGIELDSRLALIFHVDAPPQ